MLEDRQLRLAQFAAQREHNWEAALLRDREQLMCGSVFGVTRGVLACKQPRTADSTIILFYYHSPSPTLIQFSNIAPASA